MCGSQDEGRKGWELGVQAMEGAQSHSGDWGRSKEQRIE